MNGKEKRNEAKQYCHLKKRSLFIFKGKDKEYITGQSYQRVLGKN